VIRKVTDPTKIVTDGVVLRELARQGINKDYVEFCQDYAPRSLGKEHSPYAKFYRDLKSGKQFMVVSGLPMVKPDGSKVEVGWLLVEGKYHSKANLFSSIVEGTRVKLTCLSDQPYGAKKNEQTTWNPQLFVDGVEQKPVNGQPALLDIDPINESYHHNVLEWGYGVCKRRIRIIEGRFRERWIFPANPNGDVRIKHNFSGQYQPKLGSIRDAVGTLLEVIVTGDEEFIPATEFAKAVYPVEIGASATYYPDVHEETSSVDGLAADQNNDLTWANLVGEPGTVATDSTVHEDFPYFKSTVTNNQWNYLHRGIFLFDTSGLPDTCTVSAATFTLYGELKDDSLSITPDMNVYASDPASNTAVAAGDLDSVGTTAFCDTPITYAGWNVGTPGDPNDFAFNASGIAAISKTTVSKFGVANANYDVAEQLDPGNHAPNWTSETTSKFRNWLSEKGAGYKPKLVVTYTVTTEKSSSDTGSGAESLDSKLSSAAETGSGAESLDSRLFGAAETGSGTGASSLLAALTGTEETGLGSEFAAKIFSAFDSGSGIDAVIARLLAATETGSSVEVALLIAALISSDGGAGSDLSTLLKAILAGDAGSGVEALKALIETAGSDMRLRARPGQVRIPSKGVNL